MFILWYYTILGILGLASASYGITATDSNLNALRGLFQCESVGIRPDDDSCVELRGLVTFSPFFNAGLIVIVLLGLIAVVVLIFTIDVNIFKCKKSRDGSHRATITPLLCNTAGCSYIIIYMHTAISPFFQPILLYIYLMHTVCGMY